MFNKLDSITPISKALLVATLFCAMHPLWGQHQAHTHGKAELSLVLHTDRELFAELIIPAESVYGFEHAPRNASEEAQMNRGLQRLSDALATILVFESEAGCHITPVDDKGWFGVVEARSGKEEEGSSDHTGGHEAHGHGDHAEAAHDHHGDGHEAKEAGADAHHRNVVIRWRAHCQTDMRGERLTVRWHEALPDIHHIELTLLTPNRQEAISLRRSGTTIRL